MIFKEEKCYLHSDMYCTVYGRLIKEPESRLSAYATGDNAMKPGAVYRSPDIYITPEEYTGNLQLGDRLMKDVYSPQMGT